MATTKSGHSIFSRHNKLSSFIFSVYIAFSSSLGLLGLTSCELQCQTLQRERENTTLVKYMYAQRNAK